ncbi:PKD domain-containing protein [Methanomicrobium antiquum]|uniref:PKD domain-containing protein n=1 Tax=Methanomicrobium antiquum TaxID=487686 RepID=A0AAF0JMY3_9EURY|nr:PKD domain-containing protein [Methanomicrobium antiquum]WFN36896.1 PKD domain-containing protein [Methanomicrobium antiquum]
MPETRSVLRLFLLLISICIIVPHSFALEYSVPGNTGYITTDCTIRGNTEISGNNAAWVEIDGYYQTLVLHNLKMGDDTKISKSRYTEFLPSMSDEFLVWSTKTTINSPSQIVMYNLSSKEYLYASYYPANQGMPDLSGDYLVWLDGRYFGFTNIFLKNVKNGGEGLFWESKTSDKKSLQVNDGYVFWVEKDVLYKRAVSGGVPEELEENFNSDFCVSDGKIVWDEKRNGFLVVVILDIKSRQKTVLSGNGWDIKHPYISGDIVVYEDCRSGDSDIYLYDLITKTSAVVCKKQGDQVYPKIDGYNLIWTDKAFSCSNINSFVIDSHAEPEISFSTGDSVTDGLAPLEVMFFGASTLTPGYFVEYLWDFGDGQTSKEAAPVHTYMNPGKYNVSLTVTNEFGTDLYTIPDCIIIGELPKIDFTFEETKGLYPFTTRFHEVSSGDIESRMWDFGDGTGSVLRNPYHIFRYAGQYTVSLTLSNKYGEVTEIKENLIDVGGAPGAAFVYSYDETSTDAHPVVKFMDASSGDPDSWLWYFGDETFSTEQNPVHIYEKPGMYDVSLKVSNRYAEDIKTEYGVIQSKISEYPLEELMIVPNEAGFIPGDTMQFVAAAKDSSGQTRLINPKWSISNKTVAIIDGFGTITAINIGTAVVTAEYEDISAVSLIEVGAKNYARSSALPALVMTDIPEELNEDTKKLIRIFYRSSD